MSEVVLFDELTSESGKLIGVATLNSERSLNALSGDMVDALFPKLQEWQNRDDIAVVLLQGAGEKAFCAGGDIVNLYNEMKAHAGDYAPEIESYFTREYQLDYLIHTFNKPFIVWGAGIVMGGGLGMMVGGSHRVVTETSRIAMPEISIGLYPDVGGTYFLNQMPAGCGLFLGLTGASINAADAKYTKLADFFITNDRKNSLVDALLTVKWGNTNSLNHDKLSDLMREFEQQSATSLPLSPVKEHQSTIESLTTSNNLETIVEQITSYEIEDKWFNRAQKSLNHGSSVSAYLAFKQMDVGRHLSLADCFRMELSVSTKCGQYGEFLEGVRALLIDKDNNPQWKYAQVADVDMKDIDWFFESKWSESEHPLAQLGK